MTWIYDIPPIFTNFVQFLQVMIESYLFYISVYQYY